MLVECLIVFFLNYFNFWLRVFEVGFIFVIIKRCFKKIFLGMVLSHLGSDFQTDLF